MPHRPFFFLTALLLFLGLLPLAAYTQPPPQEVLLQNVNALTLYRHRHTAGRRSSGIPQLQCVGGNACDVHTPEVVQCTNTGFDGRDVQWKCEADLPTEFRFGPLEVSCEGFEYPDDPYVLAGSCGLEYTLYYREGRNDRTGRDFYDDQRYFPAGSGRSWPTPSTSVTLRTFITRIICVGLVFGLFFVIFRTCMAPSSFNPIPNSLRFGSGGGGGGGGRGGGGWWPGGGFGGFGGGFGGGRPSFGPKPRRASYRPGFWSGFGLGGLTGYGLGSRTARHRNPIRDDDNSPPQSTRPSGSSSSYTSSYNSPSSSRSGSSSSSTQASSGYGGTRRR